MGCFQNKSVHKVKARFILRGEEQEPPGKMLITNSKDIRVDYAFKGMLGHGHFGTVRLAVLRVRPTEKFAIKTIMKKKLARDMKVLKREVNTLYSLDHPNIIKLFSVYEDDNFYHMVTEYCSGGELFDHIVNKGHYSESEAAGLMHKILLAVNNLHTNKICHRDLKPENFLFESEEPNAELKLIDFGLSNKFFDKFADAELYSLVGTPHYVAPEVLKGGYGPKCDTWSAGVIMYTLLSGGLPFAGDNTNQIFTKILTGEFELKSEVWKKVSLEAKDLLKHLLKLDPEERFSAETALAHPWFKNSPTSLLRIDPRILNSLRKYKAKSKFQTEAYAVIVKHLNVAQIKELKEAFLALDTKKNGFLEFEEVELGLRRSGFNPAGQEIAAIIQNADFKGDGHINYSEFIAATLDSRYIMDEDLLWSSFNFFDVDHSGFITHENLKESFMQMGREVTKMEIDAMMREVGTGPEGISFEQFKQLMKQTAMINSVPDLQFHLLQYPLRPSFRPYGDQGTLTAVRLQPGLMEIDYTLLRESPNYDDTAADFRIDHQTLVGSEVPMRTNYCLGVLKDNILHISPVSRTVQLRPGFKYVDKELANRTKEQPEEATDLPAKLGRKKQIHKKQHFDESAWESVDFHAATESSVDSIFEKMTQREDMEIDPEMTRGEYVDILLPEQEARKGVLEILREKPVEMQVEELLKILPMDIDTETLISLVKRTEDLSYAKLRQLIEAKRAIIIPEG